MACTKKIIQNNYVAGRRGNNIERIVLHTYDGYGRSLYAYFNNPNLNPKASAHYAVFYDGGCEQYVEDVDTAYHAGTMTTSSQPNNNYESIGIEHQDNKNPSDSIRTDALYNTSAKLVAELCQKHSIPCRLLTYETRFQKGIALHRFYDRRRSCPGGLDADRIVKQANKILNNTPMNQCQQFPKLCSYTKKQRPDVWKVYNDTNYIKWINDYGVDTWLKKKDATILKQKTKINELQAELSQEQKESTNLTRLLEECNTNKTMIAEQYDKCQAKVEELEKRLENCDEDSEGGGILRRLIEWIKGVWTSDEG